MDVNLNVLTPNHGDDVRRSAMGGMHQRSLSLSAKWASDKSMAIEYLRRQREIMTWIESVLKRDLPTTDLFETLKSGVVLREMMQILFPDISNCMSPISRNYSKRMAPWKERENISVFLRQCKSIGMNDLSLFCTDDLYEGTNMVQVLFCVQHFMMFSEDQAGHHFKRVAKNEPAEFSNQELEMAMSKIEQAGVDANAFKGFVSAGSSSVVPEKVAALEKESSMRAASEPTSMSSKEEKLESVNEGEPAKGSNEKAFVEVQTEVCNQMSEDKQDVDPADDDDLNPEQDSGSDAGDEQQATQVEDSFVLVEGPSVVEVLPIDSPSAQDEEISIVTRQVLSDLAAEIEVTVTQLLKTQEIPTVEAELDTASVEVASTLEEVAEEMPADPAADLMMESKAETVDQANVEIEETKGTEAPAADLLLEVKAETADQAHVEIEVTEGTEKPDADSTDASAESTPAEGAASAQPSAEATEKATEKNEDAKPHQTEEEELEAKAMAKCTCGRCTIM